MDYEDLFRTLTRRYGSVEPEALVKVLCPLHVPLRSLDKKVFRVDGQKHWRASFTVEITDDNREVMVLGRTGKLIPRAHLEGEPWREIGKGRIYDVDLNAGVASGEVYVGDSSKKALEEAVEDLNDDDVLEIDQYGASAKVLSALVESTLATDLSAEGYVVRRLPEDTAAHIGGYYNYDFDVEKNGESRKVEVKSLWGTDTRYARLIHSAGKDYPTSSCKFATQDIFAVSLFLRTGNLRDFAFARSVPLTDQPHGLSHAKKHPAHVSQNPLPMCDTSTSSWFGSIGEVWDLA